MNSEKKRKTADLLTICIKAGKTVKGFDSSMDAVKEGKASESLPEFYVGCAFRELMSSYVFYCIRHTCGNKEESAFKGASSEQMGTGSMPDHDQIKKRLYENLVYALR